MKSMKISFIFLFFAVLFACKKKEDLPKLPTVTTAAITDVTPSSAKGGGNITSAGGSLVLASGLCYSTTSQAPTVTDDTTRTTVLTGAFTSMLTDLSSSATYYVRAYATTEFGTGYGEMRSFTTGNEAPVASNVIITGEIKGDIEVNVTYQYTDKEDDAQSGTTIQWYRANDAAGAGKVAIPDATTDTYRISDEDQGKFIWVGITPRSTSGTLVGVEANSEKKGPVGEATTVTFVYNGNEVIYGIINSSKTGRRWLDRNLGAPNAPVSYTDYANYGDLFQWGRSADGHQLINRAASSGGTTSVNGTTDVLSTIDAPSLNKFITPIELPYDWRSEPKNTFWQGVAGINNPCPSGWRIPTIDEWNAENFAANGYFTQLKLTNTGTRYTDGSFGSVGGAGLYWSSSTVVNSGINQSVTFNISDGSVPSITNNFRGNASACRCIKNVD